MNVMQLGLGAAALAVALAAGGLWAFQAWGVYRFDPVPQRPEDLGLAGMRVAAFTSADGATIHAWIRDPAPGRPVILSFYGNFAGVGPSMRRLAPLAGDGYGLVMMEYRGSGATAGPPGEERFAADARALYDHLDTLLARPVPADGRVLHGFSLGVGVAVRLAGERRFAAVILEAAYPSLCRYFERRYHGFPLCPFLWRERFDVIDRIGAVTAPMLFVHGARDGDVPLAWGKEIFAAAPGPKRMAVLPEGGHADLARHGLIAEITAFLAENRL